MRTSASNFDAPEGWQALIAYTVQQIDALLSDKKAAAFGWIGIAAETAHLEMVARYPAHLDPGLDRLLVAAWDASGDLCQQCGAYAMLESNDATLCASHLPARWP